MDEREVNPILAVIAVVAFWIAAVIYIWKLLDEGPTPATVIAAICFTFAGVVWLLITVRAWKRRNARR